jgi:hypothetical protein
LTLNVHVICKTDKPDDKISDIAIDSTDLKIFGKDEWNQDKHGVDPKRSWCKLHAAIDEEHYFQAVVLTNRFSHDDQNVGKLLNQIDSQIDHFTGDGAYDETPIYEEILAHSSNAKVVIPPCKNAILMSLEHYNVIKVLWKSKKLIGWNGNDKITMVSEIIVSLVCRDIRGDI